LNFELEIALTPGPSLAREGPGVKIRYKIERIQINKVAPTPLSLKRGVGGE